MAIGITGDAGVRANAQQPKLFTGMLLIFIFAEALALYGLIVGIILSSAGPRARSGPSEGRKIEGRRAHRRGETDGSCGRRRRAPESTGHDFTTPLRLETFHTAPESSTKAENCASSSNALSRRFGSLYNSARPFSSSVGINLRRASLSRAPLSSSQSSSRR